MEGQVPKAGKEVPRLEVPEDVAVLYAWANVQGARYRDFSAARRELRAQMRGRAAQAQREAEAKAKASAERSAEQAEEAAREAVETARFHQAQARRALGEHRRAELEQQQAARERALLHAHELSRRATEERAEAARHAVAIHAAEEIARRESQEAAEAHASALRQADQYGLSDARMRASTSLQGNAVVPPGPSGNLPTQVQTGHRSSAPAAEDSMLPERFPRRRDARSMSASAETLFSAGLEQAGAGGSPPQVTPFTLQSAAPEPPKLAYDPDPKEWTSAVEEYARFISPQPSRSKAAGALEDGAIVNMGAASEPVEEVDGAVPAWIHRRPSSKAADLPGYRPPAVSAVADTLHRSRERVASRWYALRGVFDPTAPEMEPTQSRAREARSPFLAIFSVAGGVGKTSLAASVGRSLSAAGEKILLADVTAQGILPFYFGATELRQGVVRTFSPPEGSKDAPISLLSYGLSGDGQAGDHAHAEFLQQLAQGRERFDHLLIDLSPAAGAVLKQLTRMDATVVVPVAPDMNTVLTLSTMERLFTDMVDSAGRALQPRYLLTQFDAALPLHLDVREGLRKKLGERLLPFVIRRAPEVAEALAEGMTVIDYAPGAEVASDYRAVASWVRTLAPQPQSTVEGVRWTER